MRLYGYAEWFAPHEHEAVFVSPEAFAAAAKVTPDVARRSAETYRRFRAEQVPVGSLVRVGTPLLDRPGFWAAHLGGGAHAGQVVAEAFGLEPAEVRAAQEALLFRTDRWPVFPVPTGRGATILVVHRAQRGIELNSSGEWVPSRTESATDFWLGLDPGHGVRLAEISGHRWGPGLSWPELREIARAAPDRRARARRLLLLAPALGDAAAGAEAVVWLAEALAVVTGRDAPGAVVGRTLRAAAEAIVYGNPFFAPAAWRDVAGTRICDGYLSVRNPQGHGPLPAEELRRISEVLPYSG